MIVTTKKLFEHAYGKYAIGATISTTLTQIVGLFQETSILKPHLLFKSARALALTPTKPSLKGLFEQRMMSIPRRFSLSISTMATKPPVMIVSTPVSIARS